MNLNHKQITAKDLAGFFISNIEKDSIIPEVFSFFGFDCIQRCGVDPSRLDGLIREFEKAEQPQPDTLAAIIALVREGEAMRKGQELEAVENIRQYTMEHLTEDLSIEQIASALHISYYYMCHLFKSNTGTSLSTFRNQKRLELAIRRLTATQDKIADIATGCGYNNISYFSEVFTKMTGLSPSAFRAAHSHLPIHEFYGLEDMLLAARLGNCSFLPEPPRLIDGSVTSSVVHAPDERFGFLHEAAIIEYHGVLYASWYSCPEHELRGYTPICGKRSLDGGKTWTDLEILDHDPSGRLLFCPPVYGICDDRLYMFMNEMVAPDHIHRLNLYVLDNESGSWRKLWSRPIPFKLNTNVVRLPNGKLMLPGRVGELDGFPNTPAVLISDSGKIDSSWRLVKVTENGDLPDGKRLVHPETSVMIENSRVYLFDRDDQRRVPLVHISDDWGETWHPTAGHDIPYVSSKIYAGDLSDGRHYLVANIDRFDRSKLAIYFTQPHSAVFDRYICLYDGLQPVFEGTSACHYPCAYESGGKLYIIATINYSSWPRRGAGLFVIDLDRI